MIKIMLLALFITGCSIVLNNGELTDKSREGLIIEQDKE